MTPTTVAGAPPYAAANFKLLGEASVPNTVINCMNSSGAMVPNIGLGYQVAYANANNSVQDLTGTAQKLLYAEATTQYNTSTAISISNIPFALYDLVVYSLPSGIGGGPQTTSVTVSDSSNSSTVQQSFTALPTGYSTSAVAFGSSSSASNANTIVFQGLTSPAFKLQGNTIAAFQIVERPYDQGAPTSYSIQRAPGTGGSFAAVGTASGSALSFTDTSSLSAGTAYQYRIQAINSSGASAFSNTVTVTTTAAAGSTSPTPPPSTPAPPSTTASNFSAWQSQYFTAAQLADPTMSGATADPFGSGVPNLLAYALQLNPATARPTDVPTPAISKGHLTMTYFVPASITDVSYVVEVSTDLMNWNSGAGYTQILSNVAGPSGDTLTVQDTLPTTTPKHFMRLRVTQLP